MKKTILTLLITISIKCFSNSIYLCSTCDGSDIQPAIQAAVNNAQNGDEIILPLGSFMVRNSILITKFISFRGQGLDKTILYVPEDIPDNLLNSKSIFKFNINNNTSSNIVVQGICFRSKKPSITQGDGLSLAADIGIEFVKCIDFVVTSCRFEYFGNSAIYITHDDSIVSGLIYKNEFYHNSKGYDALGLGYGISIYGSNTRWLLNPRFGTVNFIFIENNLFDYHKHSVAAGGCALYVFRYNKVLNNIAGSSTAAIDQHEGRFSSGGNMYASRATEVYNDTCINLTFRDGTTNTANGTLINSVVSKNAAWLTEACIRPRGGEGLYYNNYIKGYRFAIGPIADNFRPMEVYPIPFQIGYNSGLSQCSNHTGVNLPQGDGDIFYWNNSFDIYSNGCLDFYNYTPSYLVLERDYHPSAKPLYKAYTYPHPLRGIVK